MTGFLRNLRKNVGSMALSCCEETFFAAVESGLIEEASFAAVESGLIEEIFFAAVESEMIEETFLQRSRVK